MGEQSNKVSIDMEAFNSIAGKIGLTIAESFASSLINLLHSGKLGPTIGANIVSAMGMDPRSGFGAQAAGIAGGMIQNFAYAGVDYVTNTHNSPLKSSDFFRSDTYSGALRQARDRDTIENIIKAQQGAEARMSKLSDAERKAAYDAGDVNALGSFDAEKYARQRVAVAYNTALGLNDMNRAMELTKSGMGEMHTAQQKEAALGIQRAVIKSMNDASNGYGMLTYDPETKQMRRATHDERDRQLGVGSAILTNKILEAKDKGAFGSASTDDIAFYTKQAIAREGASPDMYNEIGASRVAATITQIAHSVQNIRDITGKNTSAAEAYVIANQLTGNAAMGTGAEHAIFTKGHKDAMQRAGMSWEDYRLAIIDSERVFSSVGLNVSSADARALGKAMKGAFGAGVNTRTAGVSNRELVSAQAQLVADVRASGEDNTYISAFRAWCEKNNLDPNDPDAFAKFKSVAGTSTSSSELAAKLGVSESSILSKGSDYLTRELSRMHDATGHLASAKVDKAMEFAEKGLDSDTKEAFSKAGIDLKTMNMSQIQEKLREAGYSTADIGKYTQAAYNAYSTAGGVLGQDADSIMSVVNNRRVNDANVVETPGPANTSKPGDFVDAATKGKGNLAETLQLYLTGYKLGAEKLDKSNKDLTEKLEKLAKLFGGELGDAILKISQKGNGGSGDKPTKDKKTK